MNVFVVVNDARSSGGEHLIIGVCSSLEIAQRLINLEYGGELSPLAQGTCEGHWQTKEQHGDIDVWEMQLDDLD